MSAIINYHNFNEIVNLFVVGRPGTGWTDVLDEVHGLVAFATLVGIRPSQICQSVSIQRHEITALDSSENDCDWHRLLYSLAHWVSQFPLLVSADLPELTPLLDELDNQLSHSAPRRYHFGSLKILLAARLQSERPPSRLPNLTAAADVARPSESSLHLHLDGQQMAVVCRRLVRVDSRFCRLLTRADYWSAIGLRFDTQTVSSNRTKSSPALTLAMLRANRLRRWAASVVLSKSTPPLRLAAAVDVAQLALQCESTGNFLAAASFSLGLCHPAIARLKDTAAELVETGHGLKSLNAVWALAALPEYCRRRANFRAGPGRKRTYLPHPLMELERLRRDASYLLPPANDHQARILTETVDQYAVPFGAGASAIRSDHSRETRDQMPPEDAWWLELGASVPLATDEELMALSVQAEPSVATPMTPRVDCLPTRRFYLSGSPIRVPVTYLYGAAPLLADGKTRGKNSHGWSSNFVATFLHPDECSASAKLDSSTSTYLAAGRLTTLIERATLWPAPSGTCDNCLKNKAVAKVTHRSTSNDGLSGGGDHDGVSSSADHPQWRRGRTGTGCNDGGLELSAGGGVQRMLCRHCVPRAERKTLLESPVRFRALLLRVYRVFCSPAQLFRMLKMRWRFPAAEMLPHVSADQRAALEQAQLSAKQSVAAFLRVWTTHYFAVDFLSNQRLVDDVLAFADTEMIESEAAPIVSCLRGSGDPLQNVCCRNSGALSLTEALLAACSAPLSSESFHNLLLEDVDSVSKDLIRFEFARTQLIGSSTSSTGLQLAALLRPPVDNRLGFVSDVELERLMLCSSKCCPCRLNPETVSTHARDGRSCGECSCSVAGGLVSLSLRLRLLVSQVVLQQRTSKARANGLIWFAQLHGALKSRGHLTLAGAVSSGLADFESRYAAADGQQSWFPKTWSALSSSAASTVASSIQATTRLGDEFQLESAERRVSRRSDTSHLPEFPDMAVFRAFLRKQQSHAPDLVRMPATGAGPPEESDVDAEPSDRPLSTTINWRKFRAISVFASQFESQVQEFNSTRSARPSNSMRSASALFSLLGQLQPLDPGFDASLDVRAREVGAQERSDCDLVGGLLSLRLARAVIHQQQSHAIQWGLARGRFAVAVPASWLGGAGVAGGSFGPRVRMARALMTALLDNQAREQLRQILLGDILVDWARTKDIVVLQLSAMQEHLKALSLGAAKPLPLQNDNTEPIKDMLDTVDDVSQQQQFTERPILSETLAAKKPNRPAPRLQPSTTSGHESQPIANVRKPSVSSNYSFIPSVETFHRRQEAVVQADLTIEPLIPPSMLSFYHGSLNRSDAELLLLSQAQSTGQSHWLLRKARGEITPEPSLCASYSFFDDGAWRVGHTLIQYVQSGWRWQNRKPIHESIDIAMKTLAGVPLPKDTEDKHKT